MCAPVPTCAGAIGGGVAGGIVAIFIISGIILNNLCWCAIIRRKRKDLHPHEGWSLHSTFQYKKHIRCVANLPFFYSVL